jgi:hypothetical protein
MITEYITCRLRKHGFVIVLETIGDAEDGQESAVDFHAKFLLFLFCPCFVAGILRKNSYGLIVVDRINCGGFVEVVHRWCLFMMLSSNLLVNIGLHSGRSLLGYTQERKVISECRAELAAVQ